jgi:histidinol-phosphate aminotransferase
VIPGSNPGAGIELQVGPIQAKVLTERPLVHIMEPPLVESDSVYDRAVRGFFFCGKDFIMSKKTTFRGRESIQVIRPYVPGKPISEVKREYGLESIIKLASNENPLGPSPIAIEAAREAVVETHRYPDPGGYYLRDRISGDLNVEMGELVLGNGSVEIVEQITEAYLDPGDEAIVGNPAFFKYDIAIRIMGGKVVDVPLKDWTHDLGAMAKAVTARTRLIFVPNPNNPTGTMVAASEVETFLDNLPKGVITVFDEAYYEYIEREDYPDVLPYIREGRDIIVLRTFSKIYGLAGLRIGYGIAKEELIHPLNVVRETFNTNAVAQAAALASLDDQEHVIRSRESNERGMKVLYEGLDGLAIRYVPSVANFVLVDFGFDVQEAFQELLKRGIIVRPMTPYGLPTMARVTVGKDNENERFLEALEDLLKEKRRR